MDIYLPAVRYEYTHGRVYEVTRTGRREVSPGYASQRIAALRERDAKALTHHTSPARLRVYWLILILSIALSFVTAFLL